MLSLTASSDILELQKELHTATQAVAVTFLFCLGGIWFLYSNQTRNLDFLRWITTEQRENLDHLNEGVNTLFIKTEGVAPKVALDIMERDVDLLTTHMERETTETGVHQAWKGSATWKDIEMNILIRRVKFGTTKDNHEWEEWNGKKDPSTIVRDFYVESAKDGNWAFVQNNIVQGENEQLTLLTAERSETMVNGWSSVIEVKISMEFKNPTITEGTLVSELRNHYDEGQWVEAWRNIYGVIITDNNTTLRAFCAHLFNQNIIQWQRVLVDAE